MKENEDLSASLRKYIDPDDIEFDKAFTMKLLAIRPDWFERAELEKLEKWLAKYEQYVDDAMKKLG